MIRVLVAANSAIARAGLQALVRADARFELAGEDFRVGELLNAARDYTPDVLLFDPGEDAAPRPLQNYLRQPAAPPVVLLAGNLTRAEVRHILQTGVRSIVLRESDPHEIVAALEAAAAGLAVVSTEILDALLPAASEFAAPDELPPGEPLTTRESEILSLLAEGAGNKEIASRLHISEHTVKFHVSSILGKLGAASRTEAVSRGYKEGLIVM